MYHFFPGKLILSIGSAGCNMTCRFCQNWQISQCSTENLRNESVYSSDLLNTALKEPRNIGIAFTYNEPIVGFEFMLETAELFKNSGKNTAMVSNGYIQEKPLLSLIPFIDAYNIDLKSFSNEFYKKQTGALLEPVKQTLVHLTKNHKHVEITNLVIPGLNDDECEFTEMINWIAGNLGQNIVLHLSRYHPMYKTDKPSTPLELLENFYNIASEKLDYVYIGNTNQMEHQSTQCPMCHKKVILRSGYFIENVGLDENGCCNFCGNPILTTFH
ncbi:MAG: AmmeMemoRadiSam system radical SAM enzyme [Bacteroidales bacterium]|nr:AmmeMemoRadiSam system radical SAM enzyme [Bacteroidales bacterium]